MNHQVEGVSPEHLGSCISQWVGNQPYLRVDPRDAACQVQCLLGGAWYLRGDERKAEVDRDGYDPNLCVSHE